MAARGGNLNQRAQITMTTKTKSAPKLRSWRIDCGNSSDGPVGFVAYVEADSAENALEILRQELHGDGHEVEKEDGFLVIAYFNPGCCEDRGSRARGRRGKRR